MPKTKDNEPKKDKENIASAQPVVEEPEVVEFPSITKIAENIPQKKLEDVEALAGAPIFTMLLQWGRYMEIQMETLKTKLPEEIQKRYEESLSKQAGLYQKVVQPSGATPTPGSANVGMVLEAIDKFAGVGGDNLYTQLGQAVAKKALDDILNPKQSYLERFIEMEFGKKMADKVAKKITEE